MGQGVTSKKPKARMSVFETDGYKTKDYIMLENRLTYAKKYKQMANRMSIFAENLWRCRIVDLKDGADD